MKEVLQATVFPIIQTSKFLIMLPSLYAYKNKFLVERQAKTEIMTADMKREAMEKAEVLQAQIDKMRLPSLFVMAQKLSNLTKTASPQKPAPMLTARYTPFTKCVMAKSPSRASNTR